METKIEYRVRPVTRYIVTKFEQQLDNSACTVCGEFDTQKQAYDVGYALAKADHNRLGYPLGDERIKYPDPTPRGYLIVDADALPMLAEVVAEGDE